MRGRYLFSLALAGLLVFGGLLLGGLPAARGQGTSPAPVRVADLAKNLGKTVTVMGRTGYIITRYESQGMHVFTLRDDYNQVVMVRTIGDTYPVMGVTYRITGSPMRLGSDVILDSAPDLMTPAYPLISPIPPPAPPSFRSQVLLWMPVLLSGLAILLVLGYVLSQWLRRPQTEWGVLSVTSGPDRGLNVPLHRRRIAIGRGVSPSQDIRLSSGDETISNRHALLEYRGGHLTVCDMSTNGTSIGGEKLVTDKPFRVNSGDLIHLGTRGTVIIVRLHAAAPAPGLLGRLREAPPLSDKTLMHTDIIAEEPAWKSMVTEARASEAAADPEIEAARGPELSQTPEATQPATEREQGVAETDFLEDEEDIPHTMAPPLVFTFMGHEPKASRIFSDNGQQHEHEADEADQTA